MPAADRGTRVAAQPAAWPDGRVACLWLPRLPLRIEVLRHPEWAGRPLVLGGAPGTRQVVQLCSSEAERAGIRPGLPLREVLALCPDALILPPDPVRAAAVHEEVLAGLQRVSPSVEPAAEHFFLDLRGLKALYQGDPANLERALRTAVPPLLSPRIGIAGGKFAATVAARVAPPSGLRVVPARDTAWFLAPRPIGYLPFSPDMLERLERLGLRTIGDLAALPRGAVQAEFGPPGARAWRLANGQDDEPILPRRPQVVVRAALRLEAPLATLDALGAALDHLLARVFADPARAGRAVRQVRLRALLADGTSWERLITFKEALLSREAAGRAVKSKLATASGLPPGPVEELSVELGGLGGETAKQGSLFGGPTRQLGQIAEAVRQLRARSGQEPLYQAVEVEPWSRIPERRWALTPYAR